MDGAFAADSQRTVRDERSDTEDGGSVDQTASSFIEHLATKGRLLLMGGMAVIAHGLSRSTRDVDVWLDPLETSERWSALLLAAKGSFPLARLYDLRGKRVIADTEAAMCAHRDGVVRIQGLDRPVDAFRIPNNLDAEDFDPCWMHASASMGPVRVMDEIDLLVTKESTNRDQDAADVAFLERRIRTRLTPLVRNCDAKTADAIFTRYADNEICKAALENPDQGVREQAIEMLRHLSRSGDPAAPGILEALHLH